MLQLYFYPQGFPRTTTQAEWKKIARWARVEAKRTEAERIKAMLLLRGMLPDYIRRDIMDKLTNPPLLIHDKQKLD